MKQTRVILTGLMLLMAAAASGIDNFRVGFMSPVSIDSRTPEAQVIELGYNDALGILFPKSTLFLKGVEIELKIPQDILAWQNSMAYGIYRQVKPMPSGETIDYQGEKIVLLSLPSKISFVLQIPLQKNHALKSGPYSTVVPYVHDPAAGPLIFRLLPVMKGLPENIDKLKFTVRIKPILTDEGGMQLKISVPDENPKPVSVRVDEILIDNPEKLLVLSPGDHHLSIVSDDYRNEVRVFTVEPARITNLAVTMKDTMPHLVLVAPENALVQLDGKPVLAPRESVAIEPGVHTVLFRIGDYEFSKAITVEKGRDYTVTMLIDVNVTETP